MNNINTKLLIGLLLSITARIGLAGNACEHTNIKPRLYLDASKKALEVGSSERGGGMGGGGFGGGHGGGMWGGTLNTAQGFVRPNYGLDCSIKKEFLKDRSLVVSIAAQDILHTRVTSVYSTTPYFLQDAQRYRDWQTYRVNVSWRFGKMDASLFKRKNNRTNSEGMEG